MFGLYMRGCRMNWFRHEDRTSSVARAMWPAEVLVISEVRGIITCSRD